MAPVKEIEALDAVVDKHADFPVSPDFSKGWALRIVRRCKTLEIQSPLVIRRYLDRALGPQSHYAERNKISRDFMGLEYGQLNQNQQDEVDNLHSKLWNPAGRSAYLRQGLTLIEAYHLKLEAYRAEQDKIFTPEIRAALNDFSRGRERDLEEAAKAGGFYPEFSKAEKSLRAAVKEIRANGNS